MWPGIPDTYQKLPESDSGSFRYTRSRDYQTRTRHALLGSGSSWKTHLRPPHRSTTYVDAAHCYRRSNVVCRSVTIVSPAKTAEPIEMPFRLWTRVGPRNHVLDGGVQVFHATKQFWREKGGGPLWSYRDSVYVCYTYVDTCIISKHCSRSEYKCH